MRGGTRIPGLSPEASMAQTVTKIGPADHGRCMTLDEFDRAEAQEGYIYELSRGVITVSDVPSPRHLAQVDVLRQHLSEYRASHPGQIRRLAGSGECKILIADLESERHPDIAVYQTPPPQEDIWSSWLPEIVIEVVSPGSEHRDYVEKREEYLGFGVHEYWIVDAGRREVLVLRRTGGRWKERVLRPPEVYRTGLLPGFEFSCEAVFREADQAAP
jgi:Uma2 family endonuclease